jgi:hypothetical protein
VKTFLVVIGVIVVLVLLVTNGLIGGALCVKGIGCLHSTGSGAAVDNQTSVQVGTRP